MDVIGVKEMEKESAAVDWMIYDRVSPTTLWIDGQEKPFKGIVIGRRQFLGIMDYAFFPLVVGGLISCYPLYANASLKSIPNEGFATFLFYFLIFLGLGVGGFLVWYILEGKLVNDRYGTSNIYINLETRELGIRDFRGQGRIIPLDAISKVTPFRLFSISLGPLSLHLYGRVFIKWDEGGHSKISVVHFMDDPAETAHTLSLLMHEPKAK
jgi:hypothetical protein